MGLLQNSISLSDEFLLILIWCLYFTKFYYKVTPLCGPAAKVKNCLFSIYKTFFWFDNKTLVCVSVSKPTIERNSCQLQYCRPQY